MVTHTGTKTLETKRLFLRRFTLDDTQAMFDNWASDPDVTKFLSWPAHKNITVTKAVLENWVENYSSNEFYQWAIVLKGNADRPIGSISVITHNDRVASAEIGYCLGRQWWHKGIMSEALKAVMDYLFDEVGMNRVSAKHDPNNPHSGGVMRKCGMQYEGTQRQAACNNQGICDVCCYAMLRSDRNT